MTLGWQEKPFESCLDRFRVTAKIPKKHFADEGQFPIVSQEADFINGYWDSEADVCSLEAPVVIYGDHTQVVKYVDFDFVVGADGVKVLKPKDFIDPRFLYYFVMAHRVPSLGYARHYRHLKDQAIKYPPLEEQQRIVAVLDKAFEGLARARAHAEANLQNARELFESKRRALLTADSDAWTTKTLNEVCIVERGSSPRPIKNFVTDDEDGVHWVKIGDTKVGSKYVTGTKEKITKKGAEKSRAVFVGDFILTNSMTYGRPYIMGIDGYIHDGWFVLRLKDEIDSDFFFHLLSSTVVQDQFEQLAAGSVVKNISGDLVKKAVLSLPPVAVQTVIASELDSISGDVDRIEKAYRDKLQDLDDLRQSLLHKAFAGELT